MKLSPIHFISSDETLLVQEQRDEIVKAARKQGFTGHECHSVGQHFKWETLRAATHNRSLFDDKTIIELRMANPTPGNSGSAVLVDYCQHPMKDKLLLIITSKLDPASKRSKWFKAIEAAGSTHIIWPIEAQRLSAWVEKRMQAVELKTNPIGIKVIIGATEGNLLACAQEVEKLRLLYGPGTLTPDQIATAIADNARFDVFQLVDSMHSGQSAHTIRVLQRLREEGAEPTLILWAIAREIRTLINIKFAMAQGINPASAMLQNGVWDKRQPVVKQSINRFSSSKLQELLRHAEVIDLTIKGMNLGNVWDEFSSLILCFK